MELMSYALMHQSFQLVMDGLRPFTYQHSDFISGEIVSKERRKH